MPRRCVRRFEFFAYVPNPLTRRYSEKSIFLLPSRSMDLNMSTASAPRFVFFSESCSSLASISPLPSLSASSNTSFSFSTSFLLYFASVLDLERAPCFGFLLLFGD